MNLFDRYKTQAERALRRALLNLQAVRKDIFNEHLWSQKLAIQQTYQASSAPIQLDPALNCNVIAQRAFIRLEDVASIIDQLIPPNDHVRQLIENRAQLENEPKLLIRYCTSSKTTPNHDF